MILGLTSGCNRKDVRLTPNQLFLIYTLNTACIKAVFKQVTADKGAFWRGPLEKIDGYFGPCYKSLGEWLRQTVNTPLSDLQYFLPTSTFLSKMSLHGIFADLANEKTNLFDDPQKSLKDDARTKEDAGLKTPNVELFWSFADKDESDNAELSGIEAGSTVMDVLALIYEHALLECDADEYDTFVLTESYTNYEDEDDEDDQKATFVIEFRKSEDQAVCASCNKALNEADEKSSFYCSCRTCEKYHACDECSGGWTHKERNYCADCEDGIDEDDLCDECGEECDGETCEECGTAVCVEHSSDHKNGGRMCQNCEEGDE